MKKLLLAFITVLATGVVSAQITWDVRLGGTVSKFTELDTKMKLGMKVGVGMEYAFSDLFAVRPGLAFAMKGSSKDDSFAIGKDDSHNVSYIEIPVMASFRFPVTGNFKIALNAGPYVGIRLNNPDWAVDTLKGADFGLGVGLDFMFGRFILAPDIEYGLTNAFDHGSDKNLAYSLSLGYKF